MFTCENLGVNAAGHLTFAGQDVAALAAEYGTPLYLMDEDRIRQNCRLYREGMRDAFGEGSVPFYASKANSFTAIYRLMQEESMGVDLVSRGEIATAEKAGFDLSRGCFHGNAKTDADIAYAMDRGVGCFVADAPEELERIESEAERRGIRQAVLLRLTPGIDTHTYEAVNTGKVDSKFGSAIETGQAEALSVYAMGLRHIDLLGFHCHVGSQVFAEDVFERAAEIMLEFIALMRRKHGFEARQLDLGGGYGVRYTEDDPVIDVRRKLFDVGKTVRETCSRLDLPVPAILLEPGRSIVADAGLTLYTVQSVKRIPGYKNYVAIDGGMTDNPRYALYRSRYTCLPADKMTAPRSFTASLVGRCCESGDIIQENVPFPVDVARGDLAAVCTTGAYNYSMASNYNRLPRPPIVMLRHGESHLAVRRETPEDLLRLDL